MTKGKAIVEVATNYQVYPGIFVPSVIRLKKYTRIPYMPQKVTKRNICVRDSNKCMYCGEEFSAGQLTLDHVFPRSRGGRWTWDNLVAACHVCNRKKADRTPEEAGMPLIHRPLPMTAHTSRFILRQMGSEIREWNRYLFHSRRGMKVL